MTAPALAETALPEDAGRGRRSRPVGSHGRREAAVSYGVLTVVSAVLSAPFVFMVSIALSSDVTVQKVAFTLLPREFHLDNFVRVLGSDADMARWILNSLVIVTFACLGQMFVSAMVAYAFARLRAPGRSALFVVLLSTMMVPMEVTIIPQFVLFRGLGWIDTLLPLIVPNLFGGAYNIFLMRQFITRIPRELDEAAQVDGLGHFGIFARIVLPLMRPVIVAVGVFSFSASWGSFFGPLIYLNTESRYPLALGVQFLSGTSTNAQTPPYNLVMVGALFLTLPMVAVYFFSQKHIYEVNLGAGSAGIR
ncbi:multiple sugar transport system permease protein [Actinopolymorpha cephalotaxi]|uniref:Multiple sugar transport system permease protein n=1 Tax=Actinopolymorpha cephalotaxi TaxID=504797 RepID=A0A1I2LI57_9ACTN|nr:carbohydrate ABC transporter permease [Actinopolymorpha cephalotaxi]NYH84899.1 multiple sugar transport system permease protein [Actinopolymorpha cephalotaxi]SFF78248.1 multiple sugar transport system permease protein [Actinopolymorpha cephalotaxi]